MKLKYLILALLPLSLAACQSNEIQKVGDLAVSVLQQQNAEQSLQSYQWQLMTEATQPITLNFLDNGRLSISTSCNNLAVNWSAKNNILTTQQMLSTRKACDATATQQENFATSLFQNRQIPFVLNLSNPSAPSLTIIAADGTSHIFTGQMTPEAKYQTQAETIFLEIAPQTKACTGVATQTCLQVKEIKYNEQGLKTAQDANWSLFYDQIEGYQHDPSHQQIIRVKRYSIPHPAADQSKYAYVYDMTVSSAIAN